MSKFAFTGNELPDEFKDLITIDYETMFQKQVGSAVEQLFDCVHWRIIDFRKEYACDLFDFFGVDS